MQQNPWIGLRNRNRHHGSFLGQPTHPYSVNDWNHGGSIPEKEYPALLSTGGTFYHCLLDAGIVLETSKPETAFSSHNSELFCKCPPALLQM